MIRAAARRHARSIWRTRARFLAAVALATAAGMDAYVLSPIAPPGLEALGRLFEWMTLLWCVLGLWLVAPSFLPTSDSDAEVFEAAGLSPLHHVTGVFASSCGWLAVALLVCSWPWWWLGWHGSMTTGHLLLSAIGVWIAGTMAAGVGLLAGAWSRRASSVWAWGGA